MPQPPSTTSSTRTMVLSRAASPNRPAYRSVTFATSSSFCCTESRPAGTLRLANGMIDSEVLDPLWTPSTLRDPAGRYQALSIRGTPSPGYRTGAGRDWARGPCRAGAVPAIAAGADNAGRGGAADRPATAGAGTTA